MVSPGLLTSTAPSKETPEGQLLYYLADEHPKIQSPEIFLPPADKTRAPLAKLDHKVSAESIQWVTTAHSQGPTHQWLTSIQSPQFFLFCFFRCCCWFCVRVCVSFLFCFCGTGIKPRASCMLGKYSTTMLASFISTSPFWKKGPQLRKCHHQIGL